MAPSTCCFCTHLNPVGAKFCNECASPLHLQPCRVCDAVDARDAQACYRCGAAFQVASATSPVSPERIVAEADETLAALKRELVGPTVPEADLARETTRDGTSEGIAIASATLDAGGSYQPTSTEESSGRDREALALDAAGEPAASLAAVTPQEFPPSAPQAEPTFDATTLAVPAEDRQWRPERRSRGWVLALAVALLALPVAVYVMRNPAQLDEWLGRPAAPSTVEAASRAATPAAPTIAAPAATPETSAAVVSAPVGLPSDAATAAQSTQDAADGVETPPPATPPTDVAPPAAAVVESAPAAVDTPAPVASAPKKEAKAAPASRAKTSAARARARERVTKPRPQAPPVQAQRSEGQPAGSGQAPRAEPCPEAVAALGLCNR